MAKGVVARCSSCGISYPQTYNTCKVEWCQEKLDRIGDAEIDEDWQQKVEFLNNPETFRVDEDSKIASFARRQFRDQGFNYKQRKELVEGGADWRETERLLKSGCDHATAMRIVL